VGYLCANFGLPKPLCSRLRPDVRDRRQTDVRQKHRSMPRLLGAGHNKMQGTRRCCRFYRATLYVSAVPAVPACGFSGSAMPPIPRERGPALPNRPSIYAYTLRRRTTEFGVVTHFGTGVFWGVSHAIAYCTMRLAVCQR